MSWKYQQKAPCALEMRTLYETRQGVSWWSYDDMIGFLKKTGINGLHNGLSRKDNMELFETFDINRIVKLLLKGLQE